MPTFADAAFGFVRRLLRILDQPVVHVIPDLQQFVGGGRDAGGSLVGLVSELQDFVEPLLVHLAAAPSVHVSHDRDDALKHVPGQLQGNPGGLADYLLALYLLQRQVVQHVVEIASRPAQFALGDGLRQGHDLLAHGPILQYQDQQPPRVADRDQLHVSKLGRAGVRLGNQRRALGHVGQHGCC